MARQPGTYAVFNTSEGTIVCRLFEKEAPVTVKNFTDLAEGKLAMANSGPNTNGSQFFITVAPTSWLTGKHTIFGEVIEGQDLINKISNVQRNPQDRPLKDVVLQSITIERV